MPSGALDALSRGMRTLLILSSRPWFWAGCLLASLTLLATDQLAPHIEREIAPTTVFREQGFAFITPVPTELRFPFHVQGSSAGVQASGALVLFEDGFPLGPSEVGHVDIRDGGKGLYSYWGLHLYFSSSDGTDPRSNGRVYSYRVQSALRPTALRLSLFLATLGVIGLAVYAARQRTSAATALQSGDRDRRAERVGMALVMLGFIGLLVLWFVAATSALREGTIDVGLVKHAGPLGYVAPIEADVRWPLRAGARDSPIPGSALTIEEDGKPLGRYETDPRELRNHGGGRYAFYGDRLAFSTLDGTDPRTNGRTYTWKLPLEMGAAARAWLLAVIAAGFSLVFWAFLLPSLGWLAGRSLVRVGAPSVLARTSIVQLLIVLSACAVAVYLVIFRWEYGQSSLLGFMGYLPISDAQGYFWCSVFSGGFDTSTPPQFPKDWCARRIVHPAALASYLGLTGWRPQLVLLVQAAVIGCAVAVFALVVARYIGRLAAIVVAFGLSVFAYEVAVGNFMTESLGVPLGLFGLTLLLAYAGGERRTALVYSGLALFSIAMFGRMGALLILPLLGLWACVVIYRSTAKHRVILCSGALAAAAAGAVLQILLVLALGGDAANSGGNYSTVLYGMSTGSLDWSQAHRDFAQFFQSSETAGFAKVQAAALANIRANPSVFLHSLLQNAQAYATNAFAFGPFTQINSLLTTLWLIGVVWCVAHARQAVAALLLAMFVGEFISAPLVFIGSSDHRVLAVSVGVRVLLVGVGLTWLISMLHTALVAILRSSGPKLGSVGADSEIVFSTRVALAVGTSVALLALLQATPVRHLFALPSVSGVGCPRGEQEVVARVGRESMALAVGSPLNPVTDRVLGLRVGQAEADPARPASWWGKRLPELPQRTMLIYAIQLMPGAREQLIALVFDGQLPGNSGTPLSFCYDPKPTSIQLGDSNFLRVLSVRAVSSF